MILCSKTITLITIKYIFVICELLLYIYIVIICMQSSLKEIPWECPLNTPSCRVYFFLKSEGKEVKKEKIKMDVGGLDFFEWG